MFTLCCLTGRSKQRLANLSSCSSFGNNTQLTPISLIQMTIIYPPGREPWKNFPRCIKFNTTWLNVHTMVNQACMWSLYLDYYLVRPLASPQGGNELGNWLAERGPVHSPKKIAISSLSSARCTLFSRVNHNWKSLHTNKQWLEGKVVTTFLAMTHWTRNGGMKYACLPDVFLPHTLMWNVPSVYIKWVISIDLNAPSVKHQAVRGTFFQHMTSWTTINRM